MEDDENDEEEKEIIFFLVVGSIQNFPGILNSNPY